MTSGHKPMTLTEINGLFTYQFNGLVRKIRTPTWHIYSNKGLNRLCL